MSTTCRASSTCTPEAQACFSPVESLEEIPRRLSSACTEARSVGIGVQRPGVARRFQSGCSALTFATRPVAPPLHQVLTKYQRYKIGTLKDPTSSPYVLPIPGGLSPVPYAEPPFLVPTFRSPYFKASHFALQKKMRWFFDTHVKAAARAGEVSNEPPTNELFELMGSSDWSINSMRMGPGKHLHSLKLPGGVKPEEFDYFVSRERRAECCLSPLSSCRLTFLMPSSTRWSSYRSSSALAALDTWPD